MNLKNILRNLGPGPLVAAAFIGPGTVTVCTLAGANFGFSLIWAMVLSIVATVILQEISGRIGIITGSDLSALLRNQTERPVFRIFSMILVLMAIVLGNAAYESGNISGANLGLAFYWEAPTLQISNHELQSGNFLLGIFSFLLLWTGSFKTLERILVALVILMSLAFMITAALTKPDLSSLLSGFIPSWNEEEMPTLVALIGTTVVPYNLFLYASLVNKQWKSPSDLPSMRRDISISVILGGVVSMAIVIVGASNTSSEITSAIDVSKGLESVFGSFAGYMMGFGLLAAGLTSALTAPLAAGFVVCGIMGWDQEIKSTPMRITMAVIVGLGLFFSSLGIKPVQLITLAQLANGILLPLISGWIIWIAAQHGVLGKYKNTPLATGIAIFIWLITLVLGVKSVGTVFGWF
ncbi:divalent metal cation transporter [Algoriphagus lacus]|uniref:Divalent metal cation transporter n=1 Tax=Algoriphagus lacus TaxID=2056311 RepID=A0A418PQ61_9BACT|nr:Nramp family divalent metal transporter [Algoriphagus lacus]RIW14436.1 divalent metal cation transporter [Algoriphagus lacus]